MKLTTVNIQGNIFTSEILEKISQEDISFQKPQDFGLKPREQVRDEINNVWNLLNIHWQIFKQKRSSFFEVDKGISETRKYWIVPLLNLLGYHVTLSNAEIVNGKSYAISHRVFNKDNFPIHIVGCEQSMDKKAESGPRLSPHSLMQQYINSTEYIYGFITNGKHFRVLRDATRLTRLSYLEFNLEQMMEESLFAEFAVFYRLLHASRISDKKEDGKDALIEYYHNEALASGSRIRERLSDAVESSILWLANRLLAQRENTELRTALQTGTLSAKEFYIHILRTIYRILFLLVIEERKLIYKESSNKDEERLKDIYYQYYSIQRLTSLVSKTVFIDPIKTDLWQSLMTTFRLFEENHYGEALGINALSSGIFNKNAIESIQSSTLNNRDVLNVFKSLVSFENENKQTVRVNYADLDVEEFGSVYEGLLEFEPVVEKDQFRFKQGDDRSSSGSHYTPEELVKPLITHSLDHIIAEKLKETNPEKALLSITVCDVACGSGHILLSAARRIGFELARVRSTEDQPSPSVLRVAIRDVIKNCVYGVDLNPLAVELCKVALWLEAHDPGKPLNFLDHHIKNGNAIVGLAHFDQLQNGIASEAFKFLPGDEKAIAAAFKKRNDLERKLQMSELFDTNTLDGYLADIQKSINLIDQMPEKNAEQVEQKANAYRKLTEGENWFRLKQLADLQIAQFFIPKTTENKEKLTTYSKYKTYLSSKTQILDRGTSMAIAENKKFFHWFLEFPEVLGQEGFDCILGNPPFLGGKKLSGNYGNNFLEYLKYTYKPIGAVDLVTYFFRRIFDIIKINGFQSLISTNTIAQGSTREGGLDVICSGNGVINHAVRSKKWPGKATVEVSLITIHKGEWKKPFILDNKSVERITPYLDDSETSGKPLPLLSNKGKSFVGSFVFGKGFILSTEQAEKLIKKDPRNKDVIFPYLNGDNLNNDPEQKPSSWIINFFDWNEEKAKTYPDCYQIIEKLVKPKRLKYGKEKWWQFFMPKKELYATISDLDQVMVLGRVAKYLLISTICKNNIVFSDETVVFAINKFSELAILNSSIHEVWAWKNSSTMGASGLRYSVTSAFETFPFPIILSEELNDLGGELHITRLKIMKRYQLGLTALHNILHDIQLNNKAEIYDDIIRLRELYMRIDYEILKLYNWDDIDLKHDFYQLDHLSENDRTRFTIQPTAKKEILKRLLLLNIQRSKSDTLNKNIFKKRSKSAATGAISLFPED